MELKLACNCGQKYAFDVTPAGNQMPFAVACPSCGVDGTAAANSILSTMPVLAAPSPVPTLPKALSLSAVPQAPVVAPPPPIPTPSRVGMPLPVAKPKGEYNFGMGILGAVIGAVAAVGLIIGLSKGLDFRFPLLGTGIGFCTGLLARLMARGQDSSLGAVAAVVAVVSTGLTLYFIYPVFPMSCIISVVVSASWAYRTAS